MFKPIPKKTCSNQLQKNIVKNNFREILFKPVAEKTRSNQLYKRKLLKQNSQVNVENPFKETVYIIPKVSLIIEWHVRFITVL